MLKVMICELQKVDKVYMKTPCLESVDEERFSNVCYECELVIGKKRLNKAVNCTNCPNKNNILAVFCDSKCLKVHRKSCFNGVPNKKNVLKKLEKMEESKQITPQEMMIRAWMLPEDQLPKVEIEKEFNIADLK